jgi:hypothetical protein
MNNGGLEIDFLQVGDGERSGDAIALGYGIAGRSRPGFGRRCGVCSISVERRVFTKRGNHGT